MRTRNKNSCHSFMYILHITARSKVHLYCIVLRCAQNIKIRLYFYKVFFIFTQVHQQQTSHLGPGTVFLAGPIHVHLFVLISVDKTSSLRPSQLDKILKYRRRESITLPAHVPLNSHTEDLRILSPSMGMEKRHPTISTESNHI